MVEKSLSMLQRPSDVNRSLFPDVSSQSSQQEEQEPQKKSLDQLKTPSTFQGDPDPTADESSFGVFIRNATANAARAVEQFAGRYGNVEKFAKDTLSNNPMTGGFFGWAISELLGQERWESLVRGNKAQPQQMLPTSEDLKKVTEFATGDYTKPKTKNEKRMQEFVEDVGATLSPRRAPTTMNSILVPGAANAAKNVVEWAGFGEDKANLAKLAVWLPAMLAGNVNGPQYASNLMNQGRNGLPNNLQLDVIRYGLRLDAVANNNLLSHADPRTALARQMLEGLRQDVRNGQTSIQSLMTQYDGINAAKRSRGLFEFNRNDQNFARRAIDQVRDAVRDEIMEVGKNHPEALHNWRNGIQAWAVIHQSRQMTGWIDSLARGPYAKLLAGPAAGLFGITSLGAYKAPIVAGPLAAGVPAVYKTGQVLYRMYQDPRLSRYYWGAIGAAQAQNAPAFINNYNKLNKQLEKSESTKVKGKGKKEKSVD